MSNDAQVRLAHDAAIRMMGDAARWQFCLQYGFPSKGQNDKPAWIAYAGDLRAAGATPVEAVDSLMRTMGLIK